MAQNVRPTYITPAASRALASVMPPPTAGRYSVTGFVQNPAPTPHVRLVAEGTRPEIEDFLAAVEDEMGNYIDDTRITWSPATGEFANFRVQF